MEKQAGISAQRLQAKAGTRQVLIDSVGAQVAVARSHSDAPGNDGVLQVSVHDYDDETGDFIEVGIQSADEHELCGVIVGEDE